MSKIKLIVALHKEFKTPDNSIYVPLELGAATRENHFLELRDDSGDNISARNPNYCELTGLYWAYKNLTDYDIIGLVHYRRYFMKSDFCFRKKLENVITIARTLYGDGHTVYRYASTLLRVRKLEAEGRRSGVRRRVIDDSPICNGLFNLTGLEKQLWFAVELDVHLPHKCPLFYIRI